MEKLGVSNEQLIIELQAEYAATKERRESLVKTAGMSDAQVKDTDAAMVALKEKIDELQKA